MADGKVRYALELDTKGFEAAAKRATKEWQAFSSTILKGVGLGAGFSIGEKAAEAFTAAVKAIPAAVIKATSQVINLGDGLADLSKQTGIATQGLQKMHFAASLAGVGAGEVNAAVGKMQKSLVEGSSAFKQLGLDAERLRTMAPEAAFAQIAQRITQIKDASGQSAAAMEIFGRSGARLLPVMKSDLEGAYREAQKLGIVLGEDAVNAADRLGDELTRMSAAWDGVLNQLGSAVITSAGVGEAFEEMTFMIAEMGDAIKDNKAEIQAFFSIIADGARFAILGMRGLSQAFQDVMSKMAGSNLPGLSGIADYFNGKVANARSGSGLSGGALYKDAAGNPLASDLKGLDPSQAKRSFAGEAAVKEQLKRAKEEAKAYADSVKQYSEALFAFQLATGRLAKEESEKVFADMVRISDITTEKMMAAAALANGFADDPAIRSLFGGEIDRQRRQHSLDMGGSGRLLSEETTNVSKFWSRDPEIQKGLDASGGSLFGEATKSGIDFSKMLGDVAHAFQVLGVGSDSVLGKFVGSLSVVGGALDALKASKASGATGLSGFLGKAVPALGLAAAGFGLLKGLFGGKSKEEKEAERKQAEEQRRRIQDSAKAMRTSSIDALGTTGSEFFSSRTITTKDEAERQGTLFAAAWGQVVKEKGIVAAADAFGDAFRKMQADIEAAGLETPAWMQAISGQMGLGQNAGFRAASAGSQNAAAFLGALGGSGGLGKEEFAAFEQEARAQFEAAKGAATEAGMDTAEATKAGFSATNPLLQELLNQSVVSGQTLSADIQEMIAAAGIVPDVDIQQLDELRQIRAAVQAMAGQGGTPIPGGGGGGGNGGGNNDPFPQYAEGGPVKRTGLALVHKGEYVLNRDDAQSMGNTNIGPITVQASGNKQTDEAMVQQLGAMLAQLVRKGKASKLTSALADDGFSRKGRK